MLKNSSTLAVSVPIKLSINFGFISVNILRETYFVDVPRINITYKLTYFLYYSFSYNFVMITVNGAICCARSILKEIKYGT